MTTYTTKASDAQSLVQNWYSLAGVTNPSAKAISWWTKQIQQDGSHTAFLNFSNGKGQDSQSAFDPNTLVANVATSTKQTGMAPWTPPGGKTGDPKTDQLPGTNTKSVGAELGTALNSPVGKIIEGVVAGAADFLTAGAATPLTTAGLAALQGGGAALQPGSNFGTIASGTVQGGLEGALAGGVASLAGKAGVAGYGSLSGKAATSALPTPAAVGAAAPVGGHIPLQTGMSGGTNPSPNGIPDANTMNPTDLAAAANASGSSASGGGSAPPSGLPGVTSASGLTSLLSGLGTTIPGILGAANVANLQNKSYTLADQALATQNGMWNTYGQPLMDQGYKGMTNPSTPAPGMPNIQALQAISARGNPFANTPGTNQSVGTAPAMPTPTKVGG